MNDKSFPCTICCKAISEGDEYFSVMNRGGDFDPCCSLECAEKQKKRIVDHSRAMLTLLENQRIEKDIW